MDTGDTRRASSLQPDREPKKQAPACQAGANLSGKKAVCGHRSEKPAIGTEGATRGARGISQVNNTGTGRYNRSVPVFVCLHIPHYTIQGGCI